MHRIEIWSMKISRAWIDAEEDWMLERRGCWRDPNGYVGVWFLLKRKKLAPSWEIVRIQGQLVLFWLFWWKTTWECMNIWRRTEMKIGWQMHVYAGWCKAKMETKKDLVGSDEEWYEGHPHAQRVWIVWTVMLEGRRLWETSWPRSVLSFLGNPSKVKWCVYVSVLCAETMQTDNMGD